jgi:preprotein translocase subunit SecE
MQPCRKRIGGWGIAADFRRTHGGCKTRLPTSKNRATPPPAQHPKRLCIFVSANLKDEPMALNPAKFIREVRQEVNKVSWPTRKETMISTTMVLVIAFTAALFFLMVDGIMQWGIRAILGLGA